MATNRWNAIDRESNLRKYKCELCNKGYASSIDLDTHTRGYDHQHRKREIDRKVLFRDPVQEAKARAAERRAMQNAELRPISISATLNTGPKKKPVFHPVGPASSSETFEIKSELDPSNPHTATLENDPSGAVRNGWYQDRYDPMMITGCDDSCPACHGKSEAICL